MTDNCGEPVSPLTRFTLLGVGAMNSPRYAPAGLLVEHGQVRVAISRRNRASCPGSVSATGIRRSPASRPAWSCLASVKLVIRIRSCASRCRSISAVTSSAAAAKRVPPASRSPFS
jgi:hypothetical protein